MFQLEVVNNLQDKGQEYLGKQHTISELETTHILQVYIMLVNLFVSINILFSSEYFRAEDSRT